MAKYDVCLDVATSKQTTITVEANSEEEATDQARALASNENIVWEDTDYWGDVQIAFLQINDNVIDNSENQE
jgi:hypothetical protein